MAANGQQYSEVKNIKYAKLDINKLKVKIKLKN